MTMPRELKPYGLRDFGSSVFLPPDVMHALDEPPARRQARLLIWATTARAAYEHAEAVGLGGCVRNSRELATAMGYDVDTLVAARPWPDGTVLVIRSHSYGPVVEVTRQAGERPADKRRIRTVGYLERSTWLFRPSELLDPEVTDAMVEAFSVAYEGRHAGEAPIRDERIREALLTTLIVQQSAALIAQRSTP